MKMSRRAIEQLGVLVSSQLNAETPGFTVENRSRLDLEVLGAYSSPNFRIRDKALPRSLYAVVVWVEWRKRYESLAAQLQRAAMVRLIGCNFASDFARVRRAARRVFK